MKEALKQLPVVPFEIPDGVMFVKVDPTTALLTDQDEQHGTVELFTKGTEPTKSAGSKIDATDFYKLDQIQEGSAAQSFACTRRALTCRQSSCILHAPTQV